MFIREGKSTFHYEIVKDPTNPTFPWVLKWYGGNLAFARRAWAKAWLKRQVQTGPIFVVHSAHPGQDMVVVKRSKTRVYRCEMRVSVKKSMGGSAKQSEEDHAVVGFLTGKRELY